MSGWERAHSIVVAVQRQADLLEVVGTTHPVGGLPNHLDRGKEQADQEGDDRDHHEEFNERERGSLTTGTHGQVSLKEQVLSSIAQGSPRSGLGPPLTAGFLATQG